MDQGKKPPLIPDVGNNLLREVRMLEIHIGMILFSFRRGQPFSMMFFMQVLARGMQSGASKRKHPLRVALLQLPVQESDSFYTDANIPLAAGYLAAFQKTYAPEVADIIIPDSSLQNRAGDAALLQWILQGKFDVVGFTLYLWNRDRSLYIARQIRQARPECLLAAGGPEVANPRGLEVFDALFEGEGEDSFLKFLQMVQEEGPSSLRSAPACRTLHESTLRCGSLQRDHGSRLKPTLYESTSRYRTPHKSLLCLRTSHWSTLFQSPVRQGTSQQPARSPSSAKRRPPFHRPLKSTSSHLLFEKRGNNPKSAFPLRYIQASPLPLDRIPNPYLEGTLPLSSRDPLYLETLRGCPRNCSYCYYGKAFPFVRHFPQERLMPLFLLASERGVTEIYLMDPSFNAGGAKELEARVRLLQEVNQLRIPLHTELVLESVTKEIARGMRQAGFRSVEVGLQSTNPRALRAVRRPFDPDRFRRGARYLQDEGIEVRTGIILGLPEDDLAGFRRTLDFVEELNLQDHLEVYPLSLLPGTELREKAGDLGILYMEHPPYWVLETPTFPAEALYQGVAELEARYGIEFQRPILPHFSNNGPFLTYVDLREEAQKRSLRKSPEQISWNLTLHINSMQLGEPDQRAHLLETARLLFHTNPYTYFKLVIEDEDPRTHPLFAPPLQQALEELAATLFLPTHYGNLNRTYVQDSQGRFTVRLFVQTKDPKTKQWAEERGYLDMYEG